MITANTFQRGLHKGFVTTWELAKVVVPVYILVTFLKHTSALNWIAAAGAPVMGHLGLPGEASLVLVMGNALNLYADIGVMTTLSLTHKQITILAVMLLLCHTIFIERPYPGGLESTPGLCRTGRGEITTLKNYRESCRIPVTAKEFNKKSNKGSIN